MIQTSEHIPKPSDEEIARVEAWQRANRFMEINALAEKQRDDNPQDYWYMGEKVDDRFSKKAMLGMLIQQLVDRRGL